MVENEGNLERRQPEQYHQRNQNGRKMQNIVEEPEKQQRLQLELVPPPPRRREHPRERIAPLKAVTESLPFGPPPPIPVVTIVRNNTKNSFRGHMKYSQTIQSNHLSVPSAYGTSNHNSGTHGDGSSSSSSSINSRTSVSFNSRNELFDRNQEKMKSPNDNKQNQQSHNGRQRQEQRVNSKTTNDHYHNNQHFKNMNNGNQRQRQQQLQPKKPNQQNLGQASTTKKSSNANSLDNDELKDYKSKIKNKYNIDYDHSLDAEYEIIEAIE